MATIEKNASRGANYLYSYIIYRRSNGRRDQLPRSQLYHVIRPLAVCIIAYLLNKNRLHNFETTQFEPKTTRRAAAVVKQ